MKFNYTDFKLSTRWFLTGPKDKNEELRLCYFNKYYKKINNCYRELFMSEYDHAIKIILLGKLLFEFEAINQLVNHLSLDSTFKDQSINKKVWQL